MSSPDYHFYKGNKVFGEFEGDFNDFFELYEHKRIVHGDVFDFSLSWWDHKDEDNVMFTSYEEMKKNVHDVIRKVATFLEKNITDELVKYQGVKEFHMLARIGSL